MTIDFRNPALKQFADQVRYTPSGRKQQQLIRAEKLLTEIDVEKAYPYQYIIFRITDFRPDFYPNMTIPGGDLAADLVHIVEALAKVTPAVPRNEIAEEIITLEEVCKAWNVSTRTVNRWKDRGLVGRPFLENGRRHLGFIKSVYDRFVNQNKEHVQRSSRFTQLTEEQKEEILRRARRMARVGGSTLTEVSRRIARRFGRATETVRYTIRNFDRQHPDQSLFPAMTGVLSAEDKKMIYSLYRRGFAVETLAERYHRKTTSVYRVINEVRAQRLLHQTISYMYHPSFDDPTQADDILAPMPDLEAYEKQKHTVKVPKDAPQELAALYGSPLLTKAQEQHLFRKMNYLKHQAKKLQEQIDPAHARTTDLEALEDLLDQTSRVKDILVSCNMRLVASVAKKHSNESENYYDLVSDGNMSLLRAVEKFDYSRGNKFSTYATWAIMKNFARSIPEDLKRRERYVTGSDEAFELAEDNRTDENEVVHNAEQSKNRVNRLLEYLEPRERQIIAMRAGLNDYREGMTLEEIGVQLGITKERVRQLNVRIMNKLRTIARDVHFDIA